MIQVIQALKSHVDQIVPLFDQYRIFYGQSSDPSGANAFLQERFDLNESIVFLALENDMAIGFVQLYPMFSSVSMQRIFVLNDLFVHASHRGKNIGTLLLERAKAHCMEKEPRAWHWKLQQTIQRKNYMKNWVGRKTWPVFIIFGTINKNPLR